ncbi:MAG: FAD-binding protein [Deltaproteobacteria bacterium]|nr:FAD-binding protein [Deltaproteobacteria bacterium]
MTIGPDLIKEFRRIVGKDDVDNSPEGRISYGYDATQVQHRPEVILYPSNAEEVSRILSICNREGIPLYPRGAGSGFAGGAIPVKGGVSLAMTRMNRIRKIVPEDLYAVVEPGVINGALQKAVEKMGLFYPPDPGSMAFSTLGGNVATGAAGLRSLKYGVTRDYVMGLEAVLPNGEIIRPGVKTVKGVVGYDMTRLLVGSEGTLAVVTEITLRLIPKPETSRTVLAVFADYRDAGRTVARVIDEKIIPSAMEFMDENCVNAVEDQFHLDLPAHGAAYLLIEVDGRPEETDREIDRIDRICRQEGAVHMMRGSDRSEEERLWKARRSISQAINRMGLTKVNEDIAVPRSRIPEILDYLQTLAREKRMRILTFGHAGDGNLHVNILIKAERRPEAEAVVEEIFREVLRLEGTISAEHGIGMVKSRFIGMEIAPPLLSAMKRIKEALDPAGILNPGKIFPVDQSG